MQSLFVKALYGEYIRGCQDNVERNTLTSIDYERVVRDKRKQKKKNMVVRYIALADMPKRMRDSILRISPLPKIPPSYDIKKLKDKGLIRASYDIVLQTIQDKLIDEGRFLDVYVLDSLFSYESKIKYETKFVLYDEKGKVLAQSTKQLPQSYKYSTRLFPIGLMGKQTLQLYYNIPLAPFVKTAIGALISSLLIILITITLLYVQFRIIRRKQQALERVSSTINGTIHDLKSPLAGAVMTLDLVKNVINREDIRGIVSHSQLSIRHLIGNIEMLLTTAKGNFKELVLDRQPVGGMELLGMVELVTGDLKILYRNKPHTIAIENLLSDDFVVRLDMVRFEGVVRNLLENALKYSDVDVVVNVMMKTEGNELVMSFTDSGWGIAPRYQKRLFRPFYRVPRAGGNLPKGHGMGLSQVREIVKAHEGKILLVSEEGKGCCFTINIPLE